MARMPSIWRTSFLILAAVLGLTAAGLCGLLLASHAGTWSTSNSTWSAWAFCGRADNAIAKCQETLTSRWSAGDFTLAGRRFVVPTAFVGFAWFVCGVLWLVAWGRTLVHSRVLRAATQLAAVAGLIASAFFICLMASGQTTWCLGCVTVHCLNLAMTLILLAALVPPTPEVASAPAVAARPVVDGWRCGLTVVLALVLIGGGWRYYEAERSARQYWRNTLGLRQYIDSLQSDPDIVIPIFEFQPALDLAAAGATRGASQARLDVFSDYACGSCRCFVRQLRQEILPLFGNHLELVIHPLPLGDEEACQAAEAIRLRGGEEALQRAEQLLYQYDRHGPVDAAALARRTGLSLDELLADMKGRTVAQRLEAERELADHFGITRTPSVLLDGRPVPPLCLTSETFWRQSAGRQKTAMSQDDPAIAQSRHAAGHP